MKKTKLLLYSLVLVFTSSLAFGQQWCWGREGIVNAKANDNNSPIATNRFGSAYITGQFTTVIIFGKDTLLDANDNTFIVKYDSHGSVVWAKNPNSYEGHDSFGYAVVSDAEDNAYITGDCDTLIFGTDTVGSGFFVKYSPTGQVLWAKSYTGVSLAIDKNGNICLASPYKIMKFNSNGSMFMSGPTTPYRITSITTDSLINIYATGNEDTTNFISASKLPCISKYDSSGNFLWQRQSTIPSLSSNGYCNSVITDRAGSVYITGYFQDTICFGKDTLISPAGTAPFSLFLVKYTSNGALLWAKQTKPNCAWRGTSLAKDESNFIYLGGSGINDDTLSFGGGLLSLALMHPASFFLKLDTSGKYVVGSLLPNGNYSNIPYNANGIAVDSSGKYCYLTGSFQSDTIFCGPDTLSEGSGISCYTAKWNLNECVYNSTDEIIPISSLVSGTVLYPNPNKGQFTIELQGLRDKQQVEIYNMLGEKIYDGKLNATTTKLDLSNNASGIYLYRVLTETGNLVSDGKFVIQK